MSIRKKLKFFQRVALLMVFLMVYQMFYPTVASALTSGPTQPEVKGFEPVGTSQMVDLFSGDFNYNIPLFELPGPDGGYPFNLAYHAGITMDQEASWVGLGWSLNAGAITRSMRGLPDEFNGDEVKVTQDMRTNTTLSLGMSAGAGELFGFDIGKVTKDWGLSLGYNLIYNTYRGVSVSIDPTLSVGIPKGFKGNLGLSFSQKDGAALSFGMGVPVDASGMLLGMNAKFKSGSSLSTIGLSLKGGGELNESGDIHKAYSGSINTSYTYGAPSYTPELGLPWSTLNLSGNYSLGIDLVGYDPEFTFGLGYTRQAIKNEYKGKEKPYPAYGYLNLDNSKEDNDMLDFNREKDGAIYPQTPNLATPILTNDIYSVVGQGIGTMYRPTRSDIGIIGNREVTDDGGNEENGGGYSGYGGGFGVEVAIGVPPVSAKIGGDIDVNYSYSYSGKWEPDVNNLDQLGFKDAATASKPDGTLSIADYEKYYFEGSGEMVAEYPSDYDEIGNEDPVRLKLSDKKLGIDIAGIHQGEFKSLKMDDAGKLEKHDGTTVNLSQGMNKQQRKAKTSAIQPIMNKELLNNLGDEVLGIYDVSYYPKNTIASNYNAPIEDLTNSGNEYSRNIEYKDHIAGFTATQPGGMRYVYGLPVYNTNQEEYVYSVSGIGLECGPSAPIATKNNNTEIDYEITGTEHYYKKTKMPPYVHSHLLTSVLGTDYVDVNNNGPDDEDYGYWVKLNYVKSTGDNDNKYKWRAPFLDAEYVQGVRTSVQDDKATFTYGEREQYYLATAETKTHIAKFIISERDDALGASQRFQGSDPNSTADDFNTSIAAKSYKLDKIEIYSKLEIEEQGTNAIPIKTVHLNFNQSNELCKNIPNHVSQSASNGKLTLHQVYFTYGENNRGSISPYTFDYNQTNLAENPDYNLRQYDKWGMYKPNNGTPDAICDNQYMPYVSQFDNSSPSTFKDEMDRNTAVWSLKQIRLPSGATINVDYEIDDYGYEQNRVATQMFQIEGVKTYNNSTLPKGDVDDDANKRKVYFEVDNNIPLNSKADLAPYFEDLHIDEEGEKQIYFKTFMDLKNGTAREFVEGYAEIEDYGYDASLGKPYIILKGTDLDKGSKRYHPFSAAAWQQLRVVLPNHIYTNSGLSDPGEEIDKETIKELAGMFGNIFKVFKGYYGYCISKEYGLKMDLNRSFIKLNTPTKTKLGGGIRVRQISIDDHWEDVDGEAQTVGQVFEYTTKDDNGNEISSGVLTKEPMIGGEESALRYAKIYPQGTKLKTHNNFFFEGPSNETYFPGPSVGYSKVTVKSLATHYAIEKQKGTPGLPALPSGFATTGVTENEFYTAKDFPVITNETEIDGRSRNIILPIPFMNFHEERFTGSQGYSIELNDMHGKPYRTTHYALDEQGNVIPNFVSRAVYKYFDKESTYQKRPIRKLVNTVPMLLSDDNALNPTIDNTMQLGVDYEFFADMRRTYSLKTSFGGGINNNQIWIIPAVTFFPRASYYYNIIKTAVTNKIIRKKGILQKVEVYDESSKVVTENKLFDPLTGGALLTAVYNEYDDLVYNYSLPARWNYDGMGAAYQNQGMKFTATISGIDAQNRLELTGLDTKVNPANSNPNDYLISGDEFIISNNNGSPIGTGTFIKEQSNTYLFDVGNSQIPNNGIIELYLHRSGRKNHVGAVMASMVSKEDPTQNRVTKSVSVDVDVPTDIDGTPSIQGFNLSSYEYKTATGDPIPHVLSASAVVYRDNWALADNEGCNTITGASGYSTGEQGIWRPYKTYSYLTDLTDDDNVDNVDLKNDGAYKNFVMFDWSSPFFDQSNDHEWKKVSEATLFNKNGHGLESRDALGKYSAALYGYNGNLSTAVAGNARYHEIGFDGFEEYGTGTLSGVTSSSTASHIDIVSPCTTPQLQVVSETQSIISGFKRVGSNVFIVINKEDYLGIKTPSEVTLNVIDHTGKRHTAKLPVENNGIGSKILTEHYNEYYDLPTMVTLHLKDDNGLLPETIGGTPYLYTGQATLHYNQQTSVNGQNNTNVQIVNTRAHTGKNSLMIPNGSLPVTFSQNYLELKQGKEYIFSAWVSESNIRKAKFKNTEIEINGRILKPTGRIIDGWQRVEGPFAVPSGNADIVFKSVNAGTGDLYVDDIRIYPKDGAIQTYVYNRTNYRLVATLDANNYATFYSYDAEGSVTLVRKETKEGIVTVQEGRSNMIQTNN